MAKTLSFTDTSPQTVKIGDTTTSFTLVCGNDNVATDLTSATSITVKLGNDSGYLKSATIDPASLTEPTTGQVTVTFNADLMTSLTAGSYAIEVWVVDSTGTSIYPSDGSTGFTITNNIQSTNGSTITTITFDDFVEAMNKAASTIAKGDKGDKGDTGTVDNAGLTTAPAFVALQTQVNNSAVGTNLYVDTKDFDNPSAWNHWGYSYKTGEKINGLTVMGTKANWSGLGQIIQVKKGDTYTFSVYARYESGTGKSKVFLTPDSGLSVVNIANIQVSLNETWQRVTETVTITSDGQINARIERTDDNTNTLLIAGPKLERGSKATDWCPNPSEILTQADYAKIQAAIVALGGSLS
ncbi:phage head spike fiber domain-containing protein [Lactiplantibacillus plantarum]|uniref:phage head spike fiber domain-containing protein n=1 Tax=Lactiplantibacillus plantarum TaxID=1590 RepID=UPI000E59AC6D|nr:carbohydrate binding domain-containing protein [Lactiplantibacillus plantarum]MCB7465323.1 carbohydrate binding domain-containing protein [Lactiplantibacillus plantarum]MCB7468560.1 carbohydrate binding domain-containing protein [Lactiplantibacillus plantarum]MCB7472712.1 carbohydrate binding domain-containing protein [Lactiplantibacillus plantarum]MCB7475144.1 carbohydrate binding domain-containing protein [Lactiplantibacillus plantarum]MCB7478745.1 carbohydrate binding domain-containing p